MTESDHQWDDTTSWSDFGGTMNDSLLEAIEQNVEAQARFAEAWVDAIEDAQSSSTEHVIDGMDGYARAYRAWVDAAELQIERIGDAVDGETVPPEEFRDIWLGTANEAFSEIFRTSAFAAATGQVIEDALAVQQQVDEAAEETLQALGFATGRTIEEVGDRLVELERRQQTVEQKIDRILDVLDEEE